jgi:hypothetical protein
VPNAVSPEIHSMESEAPPPRLKPIGEALGLHEIIASVRQLSFMKQHCQTLLGMLSTTLETTYAKAPSGRQAKGQTYELQRNERPDPSVRERLLEKLIWMGWRFQAVAEHGQSFLGEVCRFIQTYQMPLQGTRNDARWGKIDLVGATAEALPAVIELKQEGATDTPLRMLAEGLAYGCAVRKAWNEGGLRAEWMAAMQENGLNQELPTALTTVPVILLAPVAFWSRTIGVPGKRTSGKVPDDAWPVFMDLSCQCAAHGFPVHFAQFEISTGTSSPFATTVSNFTSVVLPGCHPSQQNDCHAPAPPNH